MGTASNLGPGIARRIGLQQLARPMGLLILLLFAALLGVAAAKQNVIIVVGLLGLFLLYLAPLQMSLGLFALSIPFDSILVIHEGRSVESALGAAAGVVLLVFGLATKRIQRPPAAALWWGAFLFWGAATLLWAIDPDMGVQRMPTAIAVFLLYGIAVCIRMSREEVRNVAIFTALGGVIAAGYGIFGFLNGMGWSQGALRASLVLGDRDANPNEFASTLILPFALALAGFFSAKTTRHKVISLLATAVAGLGLVLAMSRGSLMSVGVLLFVFARRLGVRMRIILPSIGAIAVLAVILASNSAMSRLSEVDRGGGRFDIWLVGWEAIKHYGVFGAGMDNFPAAYDRFITQAEVFRGLSMAAHNVYIQVWTEFGIVGLALVGAAIWAQRKAFERVRLNSFTPDYMLIAVEGAFWALLVNSLSGNFLWRKHFWMTWIMAALVVGSRQLEPEELPEPEDHFADFSGRNMASVAGFDATRSSSGRFSNRLN